MSKNILAENMRRFYTKNLKEAVDTTELDNQLLALDDNDYEGFVNVMTQINDNGPIEEWLKNASDAIATQFHKFKRKFKMKLDKLTDLKLKRSFEKAASQNPLGNRFNRHDEPNWGQSKDKRTGKVGNAYMNGKEVPFKEKPSTRVPKW